MKMYRVSTRSINWDHPLLSLERHIEEVEIDRATDKSVWIRNRRYVRFTKAEVHVDTRHEALQWLNGAWLAMIDEYRRDIVVCRKQIEFKNERIALLENMAQKALSAASIATELQGTPPC